jgi:hypothetical protein
MKAIVKSHPETNKVITRKTSKAGNEYGVIRVEQTSFQTVNGFLEPKTRSAFINIAGQHLDKLEKILLEGMEYPSAGRIVRTESFTPFYEGQDPKMKPNEAGEFVEEYLVNGKNVYYVDQWNQDASASDVLINSETPQFQVSEMPVSSEDAI